MQYVLIVYFFLWLRGITAIAHTKVKCAADFRELQILPRSIPGPKTRVKGTILTLLLSVKKKRSTFQIDFCVVLAATLTVYRW